MRERILSLLGLMKKARALSAGENNASEAARAGKARLLLIASDASGNAKKRAADLAAGRSLIPLELPFTKEELARALGTGSCALAAVTDLGFADALMALLSREWPERYEAAAQEIRQRREKARRRAGTAGQKNKRTGKRRTDV